MRVLVVEDEASIADALAIGLRAEGFDVDIADNGTDGLWRARETSYAAIILDILLPGMNGFKVCRTLRDEGVWTPILMLTAKDGELDEAEALDTGADDFLSKPFSYVVLVARLRALVRRTRGQVSNDIEVGPIRLNAASRRCFVGDREVTLTGREFAVLEYLAGRVDEVVPKRDILDNVWEDDYDGPENVVEVHVYALRRKLGVDAIETIRGGGYRLRVVQ